MNFMVLKHDNDSGDLLIISLIWAIELFLSLHARKLNHSFGRMPGLISILRFLSTTKGASGLYTIDMADKCYPFAKPVDVRYLNHEFKRMPGSILIRQRLWKSPGYTIDLVNKNLPFEVLTASFTKISYYC